MSSSTLEPVRGPGPELPEIAPPEESRRGIQPDGYAETRWSPYIYGTVVAIMVDAFAAIVAKAQGNDAMFAGILLGLLALGGVLFALLGLDRKAAPRGFLKTEDIKEGS